MKRISPFGTHCIMIKDNPEFLRRIENALQLLGLKYRHGFVEYYNKNEINGAVTLFQKPHEFAYQKEFRIYVERLCIEPLIIKIGSLVEISQMYSSEEIISGLALSTKG